VVVEVWAKPQEHGSWALLVINRDSAASSGAFNITLGRELGTAMNCGGTVTGRSSSSSSCSVRDVWSQSNADPISNGVLEVVPLSPHDSHFVLISPAPADQSKARTRALGVLLEST
jgi:hypothetical protein